MADETGMDLTDLIAQTAAKLDEPGASREELLHEYALAVRKAQRRLLPDTIAVAVTFTGPETDVLLTLIDGCLSEPNEKVRRRRLGGASADELQALGAAEAKLQAAYAEGAKQ